MSCENCNPKTPGIPVFVETDLETCAVCGCDTTEATKSANLLRSDDTPGSITKRRKLMATDTEIIDFLETKLKEYYDLDGNPEPPHLCWADKSLGLRGQEYFEFQIKGGFYTGDNLREVIRRAIADFDK